MTNPAKTLTEVATYQVRHAGGTATQAAADIAGLLDLGVSLVDLSTHDRHANTITLHADTTKATRP